MNIAWLQPERVFVVEFSTDFNGDLDAVKMAGFKTFGPPQWVWYAPSPGIKALNKLRENKPASGLTITPEALEIYKPLAERWAKNEEIKNQLLQVKKAAKKEAKKQEQIENTPQADPSYIPDGNLPPCLFAGVEKVQVQHGQVSVFTPAPHLGPWCTFCRQPVHFYELQEPPTCLWCEVHELDKQKIIENKA